MTDREWRTALRRAEIGVAWRSSRESAPPWDPPALPTLVVCPHPDDEILCGGGVVLRQRSRAVDVDVIAVTDGEAAYPGTMPAAALADIRRREQERALSVVGVSQDHVVRIGLGDGRVGDCENELTERIESVARARQIGLIVAPWHLDHHCDHQATGRAALRASSRLGTPLVQTIFWGWQHTHPDRLPAGRLRRVVLSPEERRRRLRAIRSHRSQLTGCGTEPILSARDFEPLRWRSEFVVLGSNPGVDSDGHVG